MRGYTWGAIAGPDGSPAGKRSDRVNMLKLSGLFLVAYGSYSFLIDIVLWGDMVAADCGRMLFWAVDDLILAKFWLFVAVVYGKVDSFSSWSLVIPIADAVAEKFIIERLKSETESFY